VLKKIIKNIGKTVQRYEYNTEHDGIIKLKKRSAFFVANL
jgi:hypothetical protein